MILPHLEALDRRQVRLAAWRAADESNGRFVYDVYAF